MMIMEPVEYFNQLKEKIKSIGSDELNAQLSVIEREIKNAHEIGQKNYLHRLAFTYKVIGREQTALSHGYNKFCLKDDIKKAITTIKPENSVKIIELERYPRPIPADVQEKVRYVKEHNLFDDYFVVFTDFTENDHASKADKETIDRNRDPVIFGYYKMDEGGFRSDRCYYVADWIDEYCELDFAALVQAISKVNPNPVGYIETVSPEEIDRLVVNAMEEVTVSNRRDVNPYSINAKPKSFFDRVKDLFRN